MKNSVDWQKELLGDWYKLVDLQSWDFTYMIDRNTRQKYDHTIGQSFPGRAGKDYVHSKWNLSMLNAKQLM